MSTDTFSIIDKQIDELINDKTEYSFETLRRKIENILKCFDMFVIEGRVNTKAADMYLTNVITKRNNLKKEQELLKTSIDKKANKYALIEDICKKMEFESQEEVIRQVEKLEKKSISELEEIINSL